MSLMLHILAVSGQSPIQPGQLPTPAANQNTIKSVLSIVFSVIGALSLLVITISGLRYTLAGGDESKTAKARNGIIYATVGLAVAISAQAIVYFVASRAAPGL